MIKEIKLMLLEIIDQSGNHVTHDMKHTGGRTLAFSEIMINHKVISLVDSIEGMSVEHEKVSFT